MIVKVNETRKQTISGRTINGFYLSVYLVAQAVNTLISKTKYGTATGFDASQVTLKATLKRDGKQYQLFNNNLGILGQFNTLLMGAKNWLYGTDYVRAGAAAYHENLRTVFIALGGHLNLRGTDEIEFEVTIGRNSFQASALNTADCFIDINPAYSIGIETGIYQTQSETVQAATTSDRFNLGDNVVKVAILNFEDSDETVQIVQNLSLTSDRFDQNFNLNDLIVRNNLMYGIQPFNKPYILSSPTTVSDSYTPIYPQSFIVLNGEEIDRATCDITFNGPLVNASKNFLVYMSYQTSLETFQLAKDMESKHIQENLLKLPIQL